MGPTAKFLLKLAMFSMAVDAAYFCISYFIEKRKPITPKKKQEIALFFSDQTSRCTYEKGHDYRACPLKDCPIRHEKKVMQILLSATSSLDLCVYSIAHSALEIVIKHLIDKQVKVRIVTDANKATRNEVSVARLRSWGAFVEEKSCEPLEEVDFACSELHMHHKFAIIDGITVLTGSVNWTKNSFHSNWDHLIISSDPTLVKPFQEEFDFLFGAYNDGSADGEINLKNQFQPDTNLEFVEELQQPVFKVLFFRREGLTCRPHINWKKSCKRQPYCSNTQFRALLKVLESATSTLDLCLNQFTLEDYSKAVIDLHQKGVKVRYICDRRMAPGSGSQVQALINAGIEVRMRQSEGAMHNKWFIIDKRIVASGSLNWTMQSFCGNYENVVLCSVPNYVDEYSNHFEYMWSCFLPESEVSWGNEMKHRLNS